MNEENLKYPKRYIPRLEANDILVIPGIEPSTFGQTANLVLSIISAISTIIILILNITRN